MGPIYISDTNIWIDFLNAGLLDRLFQLPFKFCCIDFVLFELESVDHGALIERGLAVETLPSSAMPALQTLLKDHHNSSLADVSCYFLARQTWHPLLTGDGRLRKQALNDGLRVHGALWLLDRLVEHAVLRSEEAAAGLTAMLALGARLPASECQARLASWKNV